MQVDAPKSGYDGNEADKLFEELQEAVDWCLARISWLFKRTEISSLERPTLVGTGQRFMGSTATQRQANKVLDS